MSCNADFLGIYLHEYLLRRFSNNNLSTLKTLSQDISRFFYTFYLNELKEISD